MILKLFKYNWRTYFLLLCFCLGAFSYAQEEENFYEKDSIEQWIEDDWEEEAVSEAIYDKSEELAETIPADQSPVAVTPLEDLAKKYDSREFNYKRDKEQYFFQTVLEAIWYSFLKILELIFGREKYVPSVNDVYTFVGIILLLVAVFFIIRWFSKSDNRWIFSRNNKKINTFSYNDVEKNIHEVNFLQMIQKAENENNTRQSIRLYYLWLLKVLSDKKIIEWNIRKTNSDYEREIKNETQKADFIYLSKVYNYIWYGEFSINDTQYQSAKTDFEKYINAHKK